MPEHSEDDIIMQGWWAPKLTLLLKYIQQQLSAFSAGMAEKMSKIKKVTNMEGIMQRINVKRSGQGP